MRLGFFFWNLKKIKLKLKVLQQSLLLARYVESSMLNVKRETLMNTHLNRSRIIIR